jgi:hypothetical protein
MVTHSHSEQWGMAARQVSTGLNNRADRRLGALGQRANDCCEHAQIIWFCARSAGSP